MPETLLTSSKRFTITRVFDAPRAVIWNAWTDPAKFAQWWVPAPAVCRVDRLEVRPGGAMVTQLSEDGTQFGEGSIYGVGSAGEAVGLFYNSKKLADLGYDGPPETLAELDEMLAKAKEAGETPIIGGNQEAWPGIHFWGSVQGQFVDAQSVRARVTPEEWEVRCELAAAYQLAAKFR